MTARKKTAKKSEPEAEAPPAPRKLDQPTLTQLTYHREAGIVRAHVEQDVEIMGASSRHGRDIDIKLDDLSDDVRAALDDACKWVAEDNDAAVYEPEE